MNRNQQLEVEIARARSLAWVEHEAVYRLGMQRPPQQTVVSDVDAADSGPPSAGCSDAASEPMPAAPVDEGPGWIRALETRCHASIGRGG